MVKKASEEWWKELGVFQWKSPNAKIWKAEKRAVLKYLAIFNVEPWVLIDIQEQETGALVLVGMWCGLQQKQAKITAKTELGKGGPKPCPGLPVEQ